MKKRSPILLVTGLAVFVLIFGCAIAASLAYKTIRPESALLDPAVDTGVNGNTGLTIDSGVEPFSALPGDTVTGAAGAQSQTISAERAARIALTLVPGAALLQSPELVNYQGRMAYEVQISGGILYLDAFSGAVLGVVGSRGLASSSLQGPDGPGIGVQDMSLTTSDQTAGTNISGASDAPGGNGEMGGSESHDGDEGDHDKEHHDSKRHGDDHDDRNKDGQEQHD